MILAVLTATIIGGIAAYASYGYISRAGVLFAAPATPADELPELSTAPLTLLTAASSAGLGWGYAAYRYGISLDFLPTAVLVWLLVLVSVIDIQTHLIPNRLLGIGAAVAVPIALFTGATSWTDSLIGLVACGGFLLVTAVVSRGGLGGGDVKLGALLGLVLGWQRAAVGLFFAFIAAAGIGGILILLKRKGRKDYMAFGPFMAAGALAAIFWGTSVLNWYLRR